jgi:hypothetical protein
MNAKVQVLVAKIQSEAALLGLKFVDGPSPIPSGWSNQNVSFAQTQGQDRAVIAFAVAQ